MIEQQLTTLGILFIFTIVGSIIAKRFKQPVVIGLLVVGTIIGPHFLNLVHDEAMTDIMIEFGAIIFLFLIGLEFSVEKLLGVGLKAVIITLFKVGIMFLLGFVVITFLGGNVVTAVFAGIAISFSSTMIAMSVLKQKKLYKRQEVPLLIALLIIEDILSVIALTVFASMRPGSTTSLTQSMQKLIISIAVLTVLYIILSKVAETIMSWITENSGDEAVTFISLGLCAGFAYTAFALGLSPSAGAFLAGSIVSGLKQAKNFEQAIKPHGLMLTSLFFISVGTMVDLTAILPNIHIIAILAIIMVGGMLISVGFITRLFAGYDQDQALFSSAALLPLGIFTLLLAKESTRFNTNLDLITITSVLLLIMAIIMSSSVSHVDKITKAISSRLPQRKTRVDLFAHYISEGFQELAIENTTTRRLQGAMSTIGRNIILSTLAAIITLTLTNKFAASKLAIIASIIIGAGIIIAINLSSRKHLREAGRLLTSALAGMEAGTTRKRTSKVIKHVIRLIGFAIPGLFFPFLIFIFNWPAITVLASIALLALAVRSFMQATDLLRNFSPELKYQYKTYKKIDPRQFGRSDVPRY